MVNTEWIYCGFVGIRHSAEIRNKITKMKQIEIKHILEEMARGIVERFHPEKIILFGSCARNEYMEDSDIDILVDIPLETHNAGLPPK